MRRNGKRRGARTGNTVRFCYSLENNVFIEKIVSNPNVNVDDYGLEYLFTTTSLNKKKRWLLEEHLVNLVDELDPLDVKISVVEMRDGYDIAVHDNSAQKKHVFAPRPHYYRKPTADVTYEIERGKKYFRQPSWFWPNWQDDKEKHKPSHKSLKKTKSKHKHSRDWLEIDW